MTDDVTVVILEQPDAAVQVITNGPAVVVETTELPAPVVIVQAFTAGGPSEGGGGGGGTGSALDIISCTAGEALGGQRVVYASGANDVSHASSSNVAHIGKIVGITVGAVVNGAVASVRNAGEMIDVSFAFVPGPVYFNATGVLTQTQPVVGFIQQVAVAVSATKIVVGLGLPITLN